MMHYEMALPPHYTQAPPSDEDRWSSLHNYVSWVIYKAGSAISVGRYLGLADGSRVGQWLAGKGRPSELMCIKLARWWGDDPLRVLRLAGYNEMADMLAGAVPQATHQNIHQIELLKGQLRSLQTMIEMAIHSSDVFKGDS